MRRASRWRVVPMRLFVLVVATFLLAAGCIGKGDVPTAVEETNATPAGIVEEDQTEAPDGRGELSAFKETNRTVTNGTDAMEHKHDYWGGETRLVIAQWDSGLIPIPLIPEGKAPGTAIADYDIPEPELVYEGTTQLELVFTDVKVFGMGLVDGSPDHPAISILVDYLSAADEPGQFRPAGKATPNEPLIIPVKPVEADMPHQTKSLWVFRIHTGEANAWTYNLTITAVKGNEVVDWPPHPDLYADNPTRVIFDGPVKGEYKGFADNILFGTDANWVYPERIISYGTDSVTVTIERGAWGGPGPEPEAGDFRLEVNNASYIPKVGNGAAAGYELEATSIDGTTYTFDVPVDPAGYDTPYGQHSRWSFRFVPPASLLPWTIDYSMRIEANGHSIANEGELPR